MAVDTYGPRSEPQFVAGGAPAIDVDPTAVGAHVALMGNHVIGTTMQRNANVIPNAGAKAVWDGLLWSDTTDGYTYKRIGGAWVRQLEDTGWVPLSYAANWSDFNAGYPSLAIRRKNGLTMLSGMGKTTAGSGVGTLITTVPVGFRISRQEVRVTIGAGGACSLEIFADGSVKAGPGGVYATWTSLSGVSWNADN
ncbi:hypothetical protein [Leifsonia sp. 71-9]|uniref:hypothetical protein n=1 Tax=Leifsonia sp. 71-9 TaxID=1895934 RepID=UPI0025C62BEF|nr:hypothetical protein [Leifsonia sp. 71-9]